MIPRTINIPKSRSFFLFGARGTGKSTFLQEQFSEDSHLWIDLTNPDIEKRYARKPSLLLDEWKNLSEAAKRSGKEQPWVIIDEVQKVPAILDVAHVGIQRHKIRFALTGSSARKLKRGAANLLAGRAATKHMYPLTYQELGSRFRLEEYLAWGGLPEAALNEDNADRKSYLDSYSQTYLREEIQIEQLVRKIEPFRMFLDVVAQMSGEVINISRVAREAGVDPTSGERYFSILVDTLLGDYLPPYDASIRKRQLQHPKFYLFDPGVWRALRNELSLPMEPHSSHFGRAFEHFIIQQARALNHYLDLDCRFSYFRTKDDLEIDLVVERPGKKPLLVEIKSSDHIDRVDVSSQLKLAKDAGLPLRIWCLTERAHKIGDSLVQPWREGLAEVFG